MFFTEFLRRKKERRFFLKRVEFVLTKDSFQLIVKYFSSEIPSSFEMINRLISRLPLFILFIYLTNASIDYDEVLNLGDFIPEHSNEWVVRVDEGRSNTFIALVDHRDSFVCLFFSVQAMTLQISLPKNLAWKINERCFFLVRKTLKTLV